MAMYSHNRQPDSPKFKNPLSGVVGDVWRPLSAKEHL
jgi:hypothetical protein